MKKIFIILFLFISAKSFAQSPPFQKPITFGYQLRNVLVDELLGIPRDTIAVPLALQAYRWLASKGDSLYMWSPTNLSWTLVQGSGGGGSGTVTSISQAYGIINTPNPITTTGTVRLDSSTVFPQLRSTIKQRFGFSGEDATIGQNRTANFQNTYLFHVENTRGFFLENDYNDGGVLVNGWVDWDPAFAELYFARNSAETYVQMNANTAGTTADVTLKARLSGSRISSVIVGSDSVIFEADDGRYQFSTLRDGTGFSTRLLGVNSTGSMGYVATGSGVMAALAINTGTAGSFVVNGGALGTPSSGTLTNATGLLASGITLTDNTTNNTSTTAHGFFPKLTSNTVYYVDNAGALTALALGANGTVLTSNGATSAPTFTAPAGATTWNGITDPTGDQALTFQAGESSTWTDQNTTEDLFTVNNATSTTNSLFSYNRTSTALGSGNNIMELVSSGANGSSSITSTALSISNTNTGTSSRNVGLHITTSGASNNYGILLGDNTTPTSTASPQRIDLGGSASNSSGTNLKLLVYNDGATTAGIGYSDPGSNSLDIVAGNPNDIISAYIGSTRAWYIDGNTTQFAANYNISFNNSAGDKIIFYASGTNYEMGIGSNELYYNVDAGGSHGFRVNNTTILSLSSASGLWSIRNAQKQGADVASVAGAIALGTDGNTFEITGTNAITLISNTNWQNGAVVTLLFTSTATLTDGTANSGTDIGMELAGNTNFVGSAGAVITLLLSEIGGTQRWREVARSVN